MDSPMLSTPESDGHEHPHIEAAIDKIGDAIDSLKDTVTQAKEAVLGERTKDSEAADSAKANLSAAEEKIEQLCEAVAEKVTDTI
ncbi:hypothetical protein M3Y99_01026400 [Aphelenchoides fujianensis]|nr:hypothetical protein M3Y99_01026400 [Aphelenchoides fujianensis]